jgi:arsenite oxidase small subunit
VNGQDDDKPDTTTDLERRRLATWLWRLPVIATLAGGAFAVFRAVQVQFGKQEPAREPTFSPITPVAVTERDNLAETWSSSTFTAGGVPAIAIRLPALISGGLTVRDNYYAAFSRVCTHQACLVDLNTDPEAIALATNYRPQAPALVCPCHLSVFLPLEAGKAVSGPAVRPLPRIELAARGGTLYATGIETRSIS